MTSLPLFTLKVGRALGSTRSSRVVSSSSAAPFFPGGWGWGCRPNFPHFLLRTVPCSTLGVMSAPMWEAGLVQRGMNGGGMHPRVQAEWGGGQTGLEGSWQALRELRKPSLCGQVGMPSDSTANLPLGKLSVMWQGRPDGGDPPAPQSHRLLRVHGNRICVPLPTRTTACFSTPTPI